MRTHSVIAAIATILALTGFSVAVRADAVADWNLIAQQATITAGSARPGPTGVLDVAMVHAAIYDAVQAIEGKYQPYYVDIPGATGSSVAATAKAARDVLVNRFPAQAASLDIVYQNYLTANGILPTDPGIDVGARAAAGIIALRACDGAFPNPPPIATPPYPDYTSGANGITSATMRALRNFFRTDHIDFSVTTTNTGPTTLDTREYKRFSDAAQEVVDARIYLGIHFRFADEAARTLGFRIADHGYRNYFQSARHHWDDDLGDLAARR